MELLSSANHIGSDTDFFFSVEGHLYIFRTIWALELILDFSFRQHQKTDCTQFRSSTITSRNITVKFPVTEEKMTIFVAEREIYEAAQKTHTVVRHPESNGVSD